MRWGLTSSLVIHAAALSAGLLVVRAAPPVREAAPSLSIPIDLVAIAPRTNVREAAQTAKEAPPEITSELESEGAPPAAEPAPPPQAQAPASEPSAAAPQPKPAPRPAERPERGASASQARPLDLDRLAEMVDRARPAGHAERPRASPNASPDPEERPRRRAGAGSAMTATAEDALRAQLKRCWRAPVDLPDPERLVVKVRVSLTREGAIARPPEVVDAAPPGDGAMKTAEERATRAVRICAPYALPAEGYEMWSDLILRFDPREMLEQ
jgi:outer membrane biosynthesis protein TonB